MQQDNLTASNIRAELGRQRMSRTRFAEKLDKPLMWVSRRINGETSISVADLRLIADTLDVPITDLLAVPAQRVAS